MSTHNQLNGVTLVAGSAIVRNRFVTVAADGKLDYTGATSVPADGVSCEDAAADLDAMTMALMSGIAIVECGAAVTRGLQVMSDSAGRAIDLVAGAGTYIQGRALDAGGAAGVKIRVLLGVHQDVS